MATASRLDYALLGLLAQEPRSGYDLRKVFASTPLAHFSDSPGAIYPALRRLARRRWIESEAHAASGRRPRELFRPTAAGRKAFREWLRRPVGPDDLTRGLDDLVLRFAFMSEWLAAAEIVDFLRDVESAIARHLAGLERYFAEAGPVLTPTGRLAFESGLEGLRTQQRWVARAVRRLEQEAVREGSKR